MATAPDPEDLTARARIRDAAMRHVAEHGFERATIRGIAETAGVSSGLVRHHFGSKQALRDACDEWLVRTIRRLNEQVLADMRSGDVHDHVAASRAAMVPYQRYIARALAEGAAGKLFDEMVGMTEEWLATYDANQANPSTVDRKSRAAVVTAMALGIPILYPHLSRAMGVDLASPEGDRLLSHTLLDIYSHPLLSPEEAATLRAGLAKIERGEPR
ncbi:MAG: TetR family transcriptional regulator [Actinophytocola sp.]|uniref:TetR/AcrR family transcriptional regulator n=1 Tax=Actinophytocola sp. TaxID=1872138 RepID=UPI001326C041|nr:TetR/AcrR family transcriptional regulator [Actinophytocola sp.]MPZ84520.1 TetR family transcriptional regulator [Actinophytocola sp.]